MTLNFPNESRSFEAKRNRVRFWGHDHAVEITFFMEAGALLKLCPGADPAEGGFLEVFDSMLDRIHEIARAVYERSRERSYVYVLVAEEF